MNKTITYTNQYIEIHLVYDPTELKEYQARNMAKELLLTAALTEGEKEEN